MIFSPIQVDCLLCAIIVDIIVLVLLAFNFLLVLFLSGNCEEIGRP